MTEGTLIVTGAGRGIGAAIAVLAARRGYGVAVNYSTDAAGAREVVAHVRGEGGRAIAIPADIADEAEILRLFAAAEAELGPLAALIIMPASPAALPDWTCWKQQR